MCGVNLEKTLTPRLLTFHKRLDFYSEEQLASRPALKLDYPLSAVCDCSLDIFAATLHEEYWINSCM
jgi:hypothetical protein